MAFGRWDIRTAAAAAFPIKINGSLSLTINNSGSLTVASNIGVTGVLSVTGALITAASIAGSAGLRIPHGVAPTSPVNGDEWSTTAGRFCRINGVTKTYTLT
jgi:hypothetical protein